MSFTIRPAKIEDAADIAFVHVESWKSTYAGIVPNEYLETLSVKARTEMWRDQLSDHDSLILAAEDESGVFGFIGGGKLRQQIDIYDSELYAIYLLQTRQKRGAGRLLTSTMADMLIARRFTSMLVWVLEQNPAAGFYRHLGAIQVAQKSIEIGGVILREMALGWPNLTEANLRST
jgi:ribosomal protein S18 acetylase RimI-like enzyme